MKKNIFLFTFLFLTFIGVFNSNAYAATSEATIEYPANNQYHQYSCVYKDDLVSIPQFREYFNQGYKVVYVDYYYASYDIAMLVPSDVRFMVVYDAASAYLYFNCTGNFNMLFVAYNTNGTILGTKTMVSGSGANISTRTENFRPFKFGANNFNASITFDSTFVSCSINHFNLPHLDYMHMYSFCCPVIRLLDSVIDYDSFDFWYQYYLSGQKFDTLNSDIVPSVNAASLNGNVCTLGFNSELNNTVKSLGDSFKGIYLDVSALANYDCYNFQDYFKIVKDEYLKYKDNDHPDASFSDFSVGLDNSYSNWYTHPLTSSDIVNSTVYSLLYPASVMGDGIENFFNSDHSSSTEVSTSNDLLEVIAATRERALNRHFGLGQYGESANTVEVYRRVLDRREKIVTEKGLYSPMTHFGASPFDLKIDSNTDSIVDFYDYYSKVIDFASLYASMNDFGPFVQLNSTCFRIAYIVQSGDDMLIGPAVYLCVKDDVSYLLTYEEAKLYHFLPADFNESFEIEYNPNTFDSNSNALNMDKYILIHSDTNGSSGGGSSSSGSVSAIGINGDVNQNNTQSIGDIIVNVPSNGSGTGGYNEGVITSPSIGGSITDSWGSLTDGFSSGFGLLDNSFLSSLTLVFGWFDVNGIIASMFITTITAVLILGIYKLIRG